jgi:hypothetical protein
MGKWSHDQCLEAIALKNEGRTNKQIGKRIGKSETQVKDAWRRNKRLRALMAGDDLYDRERNLYRASRMAAGKEVVFHRLQANRPYSEEEFIDLFGVDLERWTPDGKMEHTQWGNNFRTMMRFAPNHRGIVASEKWDELLGLMREMSRPTLREVYDYVLPGTDIMYLIEVPDAHLGMMSWGPETGNDWDLKLAVGEYKRAFRTLLLQRPEGTSKLVLRFGDDILHYDKVMDGKIGTTAKGTPQDIDSRYPKLYSAVARMLMELTLEAIEAVPNVTIIIVPGNHDKQSCFTLGELLSARFHADIEEGVVEIDNEPTEFKVFRWGLNLLGFHHGHGTKADFDKLPDTLKQRARKAWGETKYAEIHTGDKHHEAVVDERMVLMRKLKALCPNDSWHAEGQWDSYRGAQAFGFSKSLVL